MAGLSQFSLTDFSMSKLKLFEFTIALSLIFCAKIIPERLSYQRNNEEISK
jgi:hypothetical protein